MKARGKFFHNGDAVTRINGVTYGPFRPEDSGCEYHNRERVSRDFAAMQWYGINAVRTYTVPPRWLLDLASRFGLSVLVGIPWEQHILFLEDQGLRRSIAGRVRDAVKECQGHPAVLGFAIGNEIPSSIVRWYGARKIERFLSDLYDTAKSVDPQQLVTYVNYPTTEYLDLDFLDFYCFNVYLEQPEQLSAYLARLQNLAGDRPLIMGEIGLDSRRNGEAEQAASLGWQIRSAYAHGAAGVFIFAWTDEWHRGGYDIEDWDFGLTTRERTPKPALFSVSEVFTREQPVKLDHYPSISVVVCSYNGARTLRECCEGLRSIQYPNYEVLFVIDGSSDDSWQIVESFGYRCIVTENQGLSSARNTGWQVSNGEIIGYLDDDAYPDPHWLTYLAQTFTTTNHVAVGGPNVCPPDSGLVERAVENAPGGPTHVLIDDVTAEHIPGCNMAIRRYALQEIGGFDSQFRIAGDDVDLCWRLQERGWTIGFSPAAMVWHHRRDTVIGYLKQQFNYGKAEAILERKWPEKYNVAGHVAWDGRIYGKGVVDSIFLPKGRIYHGTWGLAPFQRLYERFPGRYSWIPAMPEAYLIVAFFGGLSLLGFLWEPLFLTVPVLVLAAGIAIAQAFRAARRARFENVQDSDPLAWKLKLLTFFFHLTQPAVRLAGRLREGLSPWRHRGPRGFVRPRRKRVDVWSEEWHAGDDWLRRVEANIINSGVRAERGGDFDRWDLRVAGGLLGSATLKLGIEEHGGGQQYLRWMAKPAVRLRVLVPVLVLAGLAATALYHQEFAAGGILLVGAISFLGRSLWECGRAMNALITGVELLDQNFEHADLTYNGQKPEGERKHEGTEEHDLTEIDT